MSGSVLLLLLGLLGLALIGAGNEPAGGRRKEAGGRRQEAGGRWQVEEERRQEAEDSRRDRHTEKTILSDARNVKGKYIHQ